MARAIDVKSRYFIETTTIPRGPHKGQSLCHLARTEAGLLYLNNLIVNHKSFPWMTKRLMSHLMAFFDSHARMEALAVALKNSDPQ